MHCECHEFSPGDKLYTFIGEELITAKMTMRYSNRRIGAGSSGAVIYCVDEKFCYRTKEAALKGMYESLGRLMMGEQSSIK